jgi:hypothetical protein
VVIAIIAILLAVLLPAMAYVKEKSRRMQCGNNLSSIARAIVMYADENAGMMPYLRRPDNNKLDPKPYLVYNKSWTKAGTRTGYTAMKLACLWEADLITNPRVFYCPAAAHELFKWESYSNPTWPSFFNLPDVAPNDWTRVSYGFKPLNKEYTRNPGTGGGKYGVAEKFVDVNYNKAMLTDTLWKLDQLNHVTGERAQARGVYAAFPDTHVNFCTNPAVFTWTGQLDDDEQYTRIVSLLEP